MKTLLLYHGDPSKMPLAAGEFRVKESVDDLQREAGADHARAERKDVGVVVLTRGFGGKAVAAKSGADAAGLVGRDRNADACSADDDPPLILARGDGLRHQAAVDGVIAAVQSVRAEVLVCEAPLFQMGHDLPLEFESAVVASDCNHETILPCLFC